MKIDLEELDKKSSRSFYDFTVLFIIRAQIAHANRIGAKDITKVPEWKNISPVDLELKINGVEINMMDVFRAWNEMWNATITRESKRFKRLVEIRKHEPNKKMKVYDIMGR